MADLKDLTMSVKEAAERLGKSETFVREGLARGLLPFGTGFKINESNKKRCFVIYRKQFEEFVGEA